MPLDKTIWQGRVDPEDGELGQRIHQKIVLQDGSEQANLSGEPGLMLLGFACDEGVARNKGRVGAYDGPDTIRRALANLAWHHETPFYDGGNIHCDDHNLDDSQRRLSDDICQALRQKHKVITLGGGHEIAWGSFQGLAKYLEQRQHTKPPKIGIINFDAHFDLRNYSAVSSEYRPSSGTPFSQIANYCQNREWPFHYACLGVSRASNTQALFKKADDLGVLYREDHQLTALSLARRTVELETFIRESDYLYLTIDIDVFPACTAPGVSAPAARGVSYEIIEALMKPILEAKTDEGQSKLLVADLAEYNPRYDIDNQTARLAARLTWDIARAMNDNKN